MIEFDSPDKFIGTTAAIIMAIGMSATAAGTAYSAHKQGEAAEQAGNLQAKSATDQLAFAKSEAQRDEANFNSTQAENQREFNTTQGLNLDQYNQKEARLAPYRQIGADANNTLAGMLGFNPTATYNPAPAPTSQTFTPTPYAPGATPTGVSGTPGSAATPAAAASTVPGGDYKAWWQNLTGGKPMNQADLLTYAPQLQAIGAKVTTPSAAGIQSKIILPDGTAVRVLDGDTSQRNAQVWMPQPNTGPSAGGAGGTLLSFVQPQTPVAAAQPAPQATMPGMLAGQLSPNATTLASFLRPSLAMGV